MNWIILFYCLNQNVWNGGYGDGCRPLNERNDGHVSRDDVDRDGNARPRSRLNGSWRDGNGHGPIYDEHGNDGKYVWHGGLWIWNGRIWNGRNRNVGCLNCSDDGMHGCWLYFGLLSTWAVQSNLHGIWMHSSVLHAKKKIWIWKLYGSRMYRAMLYE